MTVLYHRVGRFNSIDPKKSLTLRSQRLSYKFFFMKRCILIIATYFLVTFALSQSCQVSVDSLKGQYTGGCKHGKANGYGTATGVDTYTGNFKDGYPDGEGKYTWKNGTWYDGNWKAGLFEGNGTFNKVDETNPDSATLITGFWQEGKYAGKYQKQYSASSLTNGVSDVSARKLNDAKAEITIVVTSTTAGASSINIPVLPKPKLVAIDMIEGQFQQQVDNETSKINNRYTFRNVTFPFKAIFTFETIGTNPLTQPRERIKVEFSEKSNWYVQVKIDN